MIAAAMRDPSSMTLGDHYRAAKAEGVIPAHWSYADWVEWAFADL